MDIIATQVYENCDAVSSQISHSTQDNKIQIGELIVGTEIYPIKKGINQIGRHPDCNIIFNNPTVSKRHAEIEANNHETAVWICDLNSSNKTKLNNSILRPNRFYELKNGNVLEFGMVRAVFKFYHSMDESLIPETPALSRQKLQKLIIPGTPDSSLNNSSTLGENISMISAIQTNEKETIFRCPNPISTRTSTSSTRKSDLQNSSVNNLDNSQNSDAEKKGNVGVSRINIYDMETQKSFESLNGTNIDVHDIVTQKICLNNKEIFSKSLNGQKVNMHDIETQNEINAQENVIDIHDVETQHDIDIHDMKTPKKIHVKSHNDKTQDNEKLETKIEENGNLIMKKENNIIIQKDEAIASTSYFNDNKCENKIEYRRSIKKHLQKNSQKCLQSSIATTFENEVSELDTSRNLLGSQCLLEDLIDDDDNDDLLDESKSRSSTPSKTSCVNDDEDVNNKSTDSENIFEAATQINQTDKDTNHRINYSFKASLMDPNDSDETDNECVFQRYSFEENKKNEKSSIIRVSESDDSFTDEEGRFIEMAAIEKRAASNSFEKQNKNKEIRNDSSKDSEDLFNMLTQPINKKNKNLLPKCDEKTQTTVDEVEIDFDTPTQVIDKKNNSEINKDIEIKEKIKNTEVEQVDDFTPTQVLSTLKSSSKEMNSLASKNKIKNKIIPDDENITEMEDNTPTQIINIIEKTSNIDNNKYSNSLNSVRLNTIEEFSIENIDYETAATQPINDTEMQKSVLVINKSKNILNLSEKSNNINLDDTIERNLNAMFEDVNEGHNEEQQQISTQLLKNMLETSHCENKSPINNLNINDNSIDCNIEKSIKNSKTIDPSSNLESNKKLLKSNLKNIDNIPEDLSMPRSSPKKNHEESKIVNTIQEIQEENKKKECIFKENKADSENIGNQVLNISIDSNQLQQTSKVLENNDDDILAGLPEVKIAGTYPTSPTSSTSSEYRININHNRTKQISIKIAPKKRRSSRKTFNHKNMQNTELDHTINKSNSTTILKNFSNSFSSNFNDDRVSVEETNKKKKNKKTKESIEKTNPENLYKPRKESNTSSKSVAFINSQEKARESPFISNRRTRNSSKENIDHLSIFQVEKEALVKKVADESAEKNLPNTCVKKRSLNMTDTIEINNSKEHKNNIKENEFINTRSRKINKVTRRRQSANTPDISSLKNSSIACNRKLSDEDISLDKQPIIKIEKLSVYTPTESISSTPTREVIDNKRKNKKSNQHTNIIDDQVVSIENEKTSQNTKTQKIKFQIDEISSQIGEESQEIEMIMNNALKEQSTETKKDVDNNATNIKTRNNKKHKNIHINADNTESSSTSSIIYESDNANFEIPTSKIKHMKMSKNRSNITNILKNESVKEMKRKNKQSTKSTRVRRQSIIDSSTDENKKIINKSIEIKRNSKQSIKLIQTHQQPIVDSSTDENTKIVNEHIETKKKNKKSTRSTRTHEQLIMDSSMETNQTMLISNTDKINNLRNKRQRQTTEKIESNKKKKMDFIEETNSETNSSIEVTNSSLISTPNRTRRSMNSSFATSSPFKIKHKVLFTGISSNDYSKLLTKLGASQVEDPTKCTVLVTDKIRRTVKFLCALALSIPIVSTNWLHDSEKIGHFEELENYILEDPEAEAKFHFKLKKSLEKAKKYKLLEGYTLILTPNIAPPPPELKSIIISCGGKALLRPPSSWPEKGMIISNKEDLTNAKKFLAKAPKNITIQSTEFILTGILRQELEFNEFRLYN